MSVHHRPISEFEAVKRLDELLKAAEPNNTAAKNEADRLLCGVLVYGGHSKLVALWQRLADRANAPILGSSPADSAV